MFCHMTTLDVLHIKMFHSFRHHEITDGKQHNRPKHLHGRMDKEEDIFSNERKREKKSEQNN